MAVVDKYVNPQSISNTKRLLAPEDGMFIGGKKVKVQQAKFTKVAGDSTNSVFRLFPDLEPDIMPLALLIANTADSAMTDIRFSLWRPNSGAVVSTVIGTGNYLSAAIDMTNARASFLEGVVANGLNALGLADVGFKKLYELAGHTVSNKLPAYDLGAILLVAGSGTGTVYARFIYAEE